MTVFWVLPLLVKNKKAKSFRRTERRVNLFFISGFMAASQHERRSLTCTFDFQSRISIFLTRCSSRVEKPLSPTSETPKVSRVAVFPSWHMIFVNRWCLLQSSLPSPQSCKNRKLHEQITSPYKRSQQQGGGGGNLLEKYF